MSDPFGTFTADAAPVPESRGVRGEETWWIDGPGSIPGVPVTERTALNLSPILAAVNVLSTDVAVLPLKSYRLTGAGRERDRDHPVSEMWSLSPDGETTPLNWRQALMGHALLWGTGYAEILRNGRGQAIQCLLLDPATTRPDREGGRLVYRLGNGRTLPHENVFRLAGFGRDGLCGYNFVRLAEVAIALGLAAQSYAADFFGNGAEPGGTIEFPGKLTKEAVANLREDWNSQHRGAGKRHKFAVLENGGKFNQSSTEPEKAQLVETRKFQVVDATRGWRVPPNKLGDLSESHYANIEASNLDYYMTALLQWLTAWEQEAQLKLFTPAERRAGHYLKHDIKILLRGDVKSRYEAYGKGLADGWLNRDEVREWEDLDPIGEPGGGRKHLVQLNQTTLEKVGDEPETPAPTPPVVPETPPGEGEESADADA